MSVVTVEFDLSTFAGRAAMRLHIDFLEKADLQRGWADKARDGADDVIPPEVWDAPSPAPAPAPENLTVQNSDGDPVGRTCHEVSHEAVATGLEPNPPVPAAASPDPEPCAPVAVVEAPDASGAVFREAAPEAVSPAAGDPVDLDRLWTDTEKAEAWARHLAGVPMQEIAAAQGRKRKQVYNLIYNIKRGLVVLPPTPPAGTDIVPVAPRPSGALEVAGGGVRCVDPEMRAQWQGELKDAEQRKAVTKRYFPAERS